ncbi:4-hydroxyphenylpyruvate dioxygenase-like protein [Colossoma macropomum]|uniref:4-hydroxyphenylpyruvate dioxygenase-like protein n=1 Tax=Colossoma macropomum TaxID=42526 RepID=UPI001864CBC0|nr:4-hydroxyphenylpyruvate dioxygenase-like protein [Colossoma macropomum]
MAARVCRLHHVSLHVSNAVRVARALASRFQFAAVGARVTAGSRQLALRKGAAVFVVNERREHERDLYDHDGHDGYLYDVRPRYAVDSACNVCFEVEDVEDSCARLRDRGCDVLVPPTEVRDPDGGGSVIYTVVKSIVGNVCHTLLDRSRYEGGFLPGFRRVEDGTDADADADADSQCPVTHFDHVTFACPRRSTGEVMKWYEENFGFRRFFISSNEDVEEGYVLNQDGIGLRLTAMEYWKCSETGLNIPFKDRKEPDCKFVVAESLPEQGRNQVDSFLQQHGGPGIQHIGLFTKDIVSTAQTMAKAGVEFVSPPPAYYTEVGKQQEILEAGHDPKELKQHGILLDTDLRSHGDDGAIAPNGRYLLQVFTKPIFSEDTFFLELIERRGATGFGEGNIRALWRSVQSYMENENRDQRLDSEIKTKQTGQH